MRARLLSLVATIALVLVAAPSWAATSFDCAFESATPSGTSPFAFVSSAGTVACTPAANSNRVLIAWVSAKSNATDMGTVTETWDAVSMTLITEVHDDTNLLSVYVFGLINPASGAQTLSVAWSGGFSGTVVTGGQMFYNADQTTGWAHGTTAGPTTSTTSSITITTVSGNMVAAARGDNNSSSASITAGTQDWDERSFNGNHGAAHKASTSGSEAITWTIGQNGGVDVSWVMAGVDVLSFNGTVALTGTITSSATEADIVAGGKTLILTASGTTWVDNLASIAYVGGQTGAFAGATTDQTITFALTGGLAATPAANDLVVVSMCTGSTVDRTLDIETTGAVDYTLVGTELYSNDTFDASLRVAYRFMPGTPETQFRMAGGSGNAADAAVWTVHVYRNVDSGTPLDVAAVTATGIDTRLANPAAITPTTTGAVIQVTGCGAMGTGGTYTTSGLSDLRTNTQVDTQDANIASGYLAWTSGAYDHAAFTGGGTDTTNDSWASVVLALRPATDSAFDNVRDEVRDGCDSAQSEGTGWDALKTTTMPVANVVRTSSTVATITLQAAGTYDITSTETVTCTVPTGALENGASVVASPTFTITADGGGGGPSCSARIALLGVGCQ